MDQSTITPPTSSATPRRDTLRTVVYWVVIVTCVLIVAHLLYFDVKMIQLMSAFSEFGETFGGPGMETPAIPSGGETAPGDWQLPADDPFCVEFPDDYLCGS